eukprot:TRINITY_DN49170_c0_g1_i1.p1 TRINITY_DN49170_c0_g1~~TRINITY_DN49170_c0_g1_i1.p1  ORF type:complete len:837 (-),score=223.81 TRINITY_DN49170_c0_g1_i1:15-2525(-)
MSSCFSDKAWSGTPMWQIAEELESQREAREAEKAKKASTPVAVLNVRIEGNAHIAELMLLIPSKAADGFREVKVRGPKRKSRREAVKDGFYMREGFHTAVADSGVGGQKGGEAGEAEVWQRRQDILKKVWSSEELPSEDAKLEEPADREWRLQMAQRPRGTGWTRKKDKEFFVHSHSPMAYAPKKMQYYIVDSSTEPPQYTPCEPPHDPVEHPIVVNAGSSLVGKTDADLALPERPRSLLLKELVKTGIAMKKPLFFLDQPAACFVLFEGLRGAAAVDYCSKNFHTKLLQRLSAYLQYWSEAKIEELLKSILEELDAELLQQPALCYDGAAVGIALLLGDRLVMATLGCVRGLLLLPTGDVTSLGDLHRVTEEGVERQRIDASNCEVISDGRGALAVRRPLQERTTSPGADQAAEIKRVLDAAPDSFATLGFSADDSIDGKAARALYKKLAVRVHPDKVTGELQDRAKEAFAKIEQAAEAIETMCSSDVVATRMLHRLLDRAGSVTSVIMTKEWACKLLEVELEASQEDAERSAAELKKQLAKLGQFTDGKLAHADARRASQLLDEALDVFAAPAPKDGCKLEAVKVTRALGLRDLKKPRPIVTAVPQIDFIQLEAGVHHLTLLSSSTSILSDEEIDARVRGFARQPKAASLVLSRDAAGRWKEQGATGAASLASSVVASFEVSSQQAATKKGEEPPAKKARTDVAKAKNEQSDKIRCSHILLKHKDLKVQKDPESLQRLRGKPPVTRSLAQAERELLQMLLDLAVTPNQFPALARKHSECDTAIQPGQNCGDLGWISRGAFGGTPLEVAMFGLKVHEVSDIVSTPRGLHLVQRIA